MVWSMLQGGSLNYNAWEWTGNAQSLGDHGGASHLDARAQEFVPPGKSCMSTQKVLGMSPSLLAFPIVDGNSLCYCFDMRKYCQCKEGYPNIKNFNKPGFEKTVLCTH